MVLLLRIGCVSSFLAVSLSPSSYGGRFLYIPYIPYGDISTVIQSEIGSEFSPRDMPFRLQ